MKSIIYPVAFVLALTFVSCDNGSQKYKSLQAQNDSIMAVQQSLERDAREYVNVFNHIAQELDKVKSKKSGQLEQLSTNLKEEENAVVNDNIAMFNSILKDNQEEMEKLRKQAVHNSFRANELQASIDRITLQLENERTKTVAPAKPNNSAAKDIVINELKDSLQALTVELGLTKEKLTQQTALVAKYEANWYVGYYITGSKSDLISKKVLTKKGLCKTALFQEVVNNGYFKQVDILKTKEIKLPSSVKGKVLSAHPKSSYKFVKQGDDKLIQIINPENFWSVTRYLVIQ